MEPTRECAYVFQFCAKPHLVVGVVNEAVWMLKLGVMRRGGGRSGALVLSLWGRELESWRAPATSTTYTRPDQTRCCMARNLDEAWSPITTIWRAEYAFLKNM